MRLQIMIGKTTELHKINTTKSLTIAHLNYTCFEVLMNTNQSMRNEIKETNGQWRVQEQIATTTLEYWIKGAPQSNKQASTHSNFQPNREMKWSYSATPGNTIWGFFRLVVLPSYLVVLPSFQIVICRVG